MTRLVRLFLSLEAAAFFAAALVHSGVLLGGYEHWKAATAESVIGLVLAGALLASLVAPGWSRLVGLAAQGFALLGTLVGLSRSPSASALARCPISCSTAGSSQRWSPGS